MMKYILKWMTCIIFLMLISAHVSSQNTMCNAPIYSKPKKVRVAFHYVRGSAENNENFTKKKDEKRINGKNWSKQLIKKANEQLAHLHRNWKSPKDAVHTQDAGFRYVLKKVKYIKDDSYASIDTYSERSSNEINLHHGKKHHKMVNIYFHEGYFRGMNNGGGITNRSHRPEEVFIKLYNFMYKKYKDFDGAEFILREEAALLNHEMGHLLGLDHDWVKNDGMGDTIPYKERSCNDKQNDYKDCSNNYMSIPPAIPSLEGSFTACQIVRMHTLLKGERQIYVK